MLLITSAVPQEGKTTITIGLGAALADSGRSVLIVDADFRRPRVHLLTGVRDRPGFSDCLMGRASWEQAVFPVPGVPRLSVIPSGPIPANAAELLSMPLADEILRALTLAYDFVLIDSPPLMMVTDGLLLATVADAALLVTRAGATPYKVVQRACTSLHMAGSRILGVVLNDADLRRQGQYAYYPGYGFGLGYSSGTSRSYRSKESVAGSKS